MRTITDMLRRPVVESKRSMLTMMSDDSFYKCLYKCGHYFPKKISAMIDNADIFENFRIRIMPNLDTSGKDITGLTVTAGENILSNLLGDDIGCGVTIAKLENFRPNFKMVQANGNLTNGATWRIWVILDKFIRENISNANEKNSTKNLSANIFDLSQLCIFNHINLEKVFQDFRTLGAGDHFIEIDKDDDENFFIVVHCGSQNLGKEVSEFYFKAGQKFSTDKDKMTYLSGDLKENYFHDVQIVQNYAAFNRQFITEKICQNMGWKFSDILSCPHNFIDISQEEPILRKGAISAKKGEPVVIPISPEKGTILGVGKGNAEWNFSAPSGAGLIPKSQGILAKLKDKLKNFYHPLTYEPVYKSLYEIRETITELVEVKKIIRPVYNFKN